MKGRIVSLLIVVVFLLTKPSLGKLDVNSKYMSVSYGYLPTWEFVITTQKWVYTAPVKEAPPRFTVNPKMKGRITLKNIGSILAKRLMKITRKKMILHKKDNKINIRVAPMHVRRKCPFKVVIFFDYNSYELKDSEKKKLTGVMECLKSADLIELYGYADNVGSCDFNLKLAEARTRSVLDFLRNNVKFNGRINIFPRGECCQIEPGGDDSRERRVEIFIHYKER